MTGASCPAWLAEDGDPFGKAEICGDHERGFFVELADQVEQQGSARRREWQVAEFVENDGIHQHQLLGETASSPLCLFPFQQIDEINGVEEADPLVLMDRCHSQGDRQMGFASAGAADQNQVVGGCQILAASQMLDPGRINRGLGKIKPGEITMQGGSART